jgi:hypothetical protein
MHHWWLRLVSVVCCFALVSCGSRDTTRKLSASDVVGTWRMTPAAKGILDRDGVTGATGQPYTITFNADGTVTFASVFDDFEGLPGVQWCVAPRTRHDGRQQRAQSERGPDGVS